MQYISLTRVAIALALPMAAAGALASPDDYQCRTIGSMSIIFVPGTTELQIQQTLRRVAPYATDEGDFQVGTRWNATSFGSTGSTGNPMHISYSLVPDGVNVPWSGLGSGPNQLHATLNSQFGGNTALWQSKINQVFQRWDQLSGVTYHLMPDDGASLHTSPGVQNIRGDCRISMIPLIDNQVLAYNFFPNNGDMVMNKNFSWNMSAQDYRFVRNTLGHEHGHGLGIEHVMPINSTKLMEPFLSTNFDGPQSDDIQAAQWLYGDPLENNDNNAQKSDLGTVSNNQQIDFLAIERNTDTDWFKVLIPAGNALTVSVTPVGSSYLQGPQGGGGSPTLRDSLRIHDLRLTVYQSDGTTLIQTVNANGLGLGETISNIQRPGNGEVTVKVDSVTATGDIQRYRMNFGLTTANVVVPVDDLTIVRGVTVSGGLSSLNISDDIRLVLRPGVIFSTGQAPIEYVVEGDSVELDPTNLRMTIEGSATSGTVQRTVELFNFDTSAYESVATANMATSEAVVNIDVSTNPGRFVAADGTIRARVRARLTGPVVSYPWSFSTDYISWTLTP